MVVWVYAGLSAAKQVTGSVREADVRSGSCTQAPLATACPRPKGALQVRICPLKQLAQIRFTVETRLMRSSHKIILLCKTRGRRGPQSCLEDIFLKKKV